MAARIFDLYEKQSAQAAFCGNSARHKMWQTRISFRWKN